MNEIDKWSDKRAWNDDEMSKRRKKTNEKSNSNLFVSVIWSISFGKLRKNSPQIRIVVNEENMNNKNTTNKIERKKKLKLFSDVTPNIFIEPEFGESISQMCAIKSVKKGKQFVYKNIITIFWFFLSFIWNPVGITKTHKNKNQNQYITQLSVCIRNTLTNGNNNNNKNNKFSRMCHNFFFFVCVFIDILFDHNDTDVKHITDWVKQREKKDDK